MVRKALKLKTYLMLVAWMMIFMHNIIPHNHIDDNITGCHDVIQKTAPDNNKSDVTKGFTNQPCDVTVCHISGFLFHNFNQENLLNGTSQELNLNPLRIADPVIACENQSYISDHPEGTFLFRAPPII
jgi:hypothetical protein